MTKKKTKVWIVDDNENYCILLSESLRFNKKIIVDDYFRSVPEVLKALRKTVHAPKIILLDIRMPEISGIEGITKIHRYSPEIKILMLTSHDDQEEIQESLKNGASGYLLKSSTAVDIIRAIEKVMEGGSPIDPMITKKILGLLMSVHNGSKNSIPLTKREKEIIRFVLKNMSDKKIASAMNVSYYTITTHLKHIYKKLHVHSKQSLVIKAYKEKIFGF